jgi:hypothetical protein
MDYPERRLITEDEVMSWAADDIANGDIEGPIDIGIDELVAQMNDSGLVTLREDSAPDYASGERAFYPDPTEDLSWEDIYGFDRGNHPIGAL